MAKVSLRAYNREIEAMIDRGHLDEAVAHCQHILKIFPKHLETYRLLGKAYLEARRHSDAIDIFSRVLTAEPNDFVAHVGMSIIRDEQNKLDDAIWHMERAFEVQSANPAIQGELQRLYGRRDGVQPPRIRMTRGALAHMYVRGELFPQAISETRGILEEDPGRSDIQVLLAKAYYLSGQKKDAADAASAVLKRYPYCLDANLVLAEVLGADRPESAQTYRHRVVELDPYAAQAPDNMFHAADVSDAAVTIDHLDWDGQSVGMSSEWETERAIALESGVRDRDVQPDWLKEPSTSTTSSALPATPFDSEQEASASPAQPEEEIPDFLRAAGWGAATGAFDESKASIFEDEPVSTAEPIAQGDLPDWVKAMAPQETSQPDAEQEEEMPDWINKIGTADLPAPAQSAQSSNGQPDWLSDMEESASSADQPDWLSGLGDEEGQPASQASDGQPDWLGGLEESASSADQPDWLSGLGDEEGQPVSQASDSQPDWLSGLEESASSADQPDWLSGLGDEEGQPASRPSVEQPDWLKNLGDEQEPLPQPLEEQQSAHVDEEQAKPDWVKGFEEEEQSAPALEDQIDWLRDFGSEAEAVSSTESSGATSFLNNLREDGMGKPVSSQAATIDTGSLGTTEDEQDDSFAWLENLAAKQGATEGLLTKPEERREEEPDWIKQAKSLSQPESHQPPVEETPSPPVSQPMAKVDDLGKSGEEIDDALAWFESLAAKQGATEGLLTKPEDRKEQEPEWVRQAKSASQPPTVQQPPAEQTPVEEETAPEPEPVAPAPPPTHGVEDLGKSGKEIDDALAWFESLAVKQGATEGLLTKPEDRSGQEPEWVQQVKKSTGELQTAPAQPTPVEEQPVEETIPEPESEIDESLAGAETETWLKGLDEIEEKHPAAPAEEFDTAAWLKSLDEPEQEPITLDSTTDDLPAWMHRVGEEEAPEIESASQVEEVEAVEESPVPVEESVSEDVPAWLSSLEEEEQTPPTQESEDLPAWMRDETGEVVAEPTKIEPTRSADWKPVDEKKAEAVQTPPPAPKPAPEPTVAPKPETKPAPKAKKAAPKKADEAKPAAPPEPYKEPVTRRGTGMLTMPVDPILGSARAELSRSNIPGALETYEKLIKKGRFLEEVIYDLREALYRYPVEVSIWQTLGDAYMRANQLQDALDAYTKAEELLR